MPTIAYRMLGHTVFMSAPRLGNDIHEGRLAGADALERPLERTRQRIGVLDRPFSIYAVSLCHFGVVDIRIGDRGADLRTVGAPASLAAHSLYDHQLGVIRAIVVNDQQERDLVMSRCPQRPRADEVEVAVPHYSDAQAAVPAMAQRASYRPRSVIADSEPPRVTVISIVLVKVQQATLPVAGELMAGHDGPVVGANLCPQLGNQARNADRTGIPSVARFLDPARAPGFVGLGKLGTALIERTAAVPA